MCVEILSHPGYSKDAIQRQLDLLKVSKDVSPLN